MGHDFFFGDFLRVADAEALEAYYRGFLLLVAGALATSGQVVISVFIQLQYLAKQLFWYVFNLTEGVQLV